MVCVVPDVSSVCCCCLTNWWMRTAGPGSWSGLNILHSFVEKLVILSTGDQSEASIHVMRSLSANQRPVLVMLLTGGSVAMFLFSWILTYLEWAHISALSDGQLLQNISHHQEMNASIRSDARGCIYL